jgi:hypothetical protein
MLTRSEQGKQRRQLRSGTRPHLQPSRRKWMPLGSSCTPSAASIAQRRPASAGVDFVCGGCSRIMMPLSDLLRTLTTSTRVAQHSSNIYMLKKNSVHTGCSRHTMPSSMSASITCWHGKHSAAGSVISSGDGTRSSSGSVQPRTASCCGCRASRCCSGCTGCGSSAMLGCGSYIPCCHTAAVLVDWQQTQSDG